MNKLVYPRQQALQNPESLATVLHAILREQYGEEFYGWDLTTVFLEAKADFNADMAPEVIDRIGALQVLMTTDAFFTRLDAFLSICGTLSHGSPAFNMFDKISVEACTWAIAEVAMNRDLLPFSYPVKQYLKAILRQDGYSEDEYPGVIAEALEMKPKAEAVRASLGAAHNQDNIAKYLEEQTQDLAFQFKKIPDLAQLESVIERDGFEAAIPPGV